jgi:glycosyltransferase involved in cell wall biosynthesis
LAFVGAVYEHKGANLLPKIMEMVLDEIPYAKLRIIGSGKLESELKSEFERKEMSKSIEFLGVISHEQVREILAQSDILLFPTRVEAFGLVIAEAMMEGAVPVVTLLPGITDATVEDGKTGYLIPKDNVDAFAQKVIELGKDKNLLMRMSQASKIVAQERLSLSTMSRNYTNLITELSHQ